MPSRYNSSSGNPRGAARGSHAIDRFPVRCALCAAAAVALVGLAPSASAQSQMVTGGDIPGSFKLPGSETSVRLGGYVKLDGIYSSKRSTGLGDQLFGAGNVPVGAAAGAAEEHFEFHARQSRFNVSTNTPTGMGSLTTLIEFDFFGSSGNQIVSNSNNPRLRHAFGTLGSFGAGQTWSNFMFTPALADTLNFGAPTGLIFIRQGQVRWTEKFDGGDFVISAENPESVIGSDTAGVVTKPDSDRYPDIVAHVHFDAGKAKLGIAGMARNVKIDTPAATDDKWGASLAFSGRVPTMWGQDDLRFQVIGGTAIGRYQAGFYSDGVVGPAGQLLALPKVVGGYAAYRHYWTPNLRSSLVAAGSRADLPAGAFGELNKSSRSGHLNLIWNPVKKVDLGVEYTHIRRETENGESGSLNRVQFSAQYTF